MEESSGSLHFVYNQRIVVASESVTNSGETLHNWRIVVILDLCSCRDIALATEAAGSFFFFFLFPNVKRHVFLWISTATEKCKPRAHIWRVKRRALSGFRKQTGHPAVGGRDSLKHPKKGTNYSLGFVYNQSLLRKVPLLISGLAISSVSNL